MKLIHGMPGFDRGWYAPQNLIDAGLAKTKNRGGKKSYDRYQLFDLAKDPNERNDLAAILYKKRGDKKQQKMIQAKVDEIKRKYDEFMRKYKIIPHKESEKTEGSWKTKAGNTDICWCQPKDAKSCEATIKDIR